jgi:hypothetical protein
MSRETKSSGRGGRPHGRKPRPHISIDGDTLIPKSEATQEQGVAAKTPRSSDPELRPWGKLN